MVRMSELEKGGRRRAVGGEWWRQRRWRRVTADFVRVTGDGSPKIMDGRSNGRPAWKSDVVSRKQCGG